MPYRVNDKIKNYIVESYQIRCNDGLTKKERHRLKVRSNEYTMSSLAAGLSVEEIGKKAHWSTSRVEEVINNNTENKESIENEDKESMIKKVKADQLYYMSVAIPKVLEAMLQELWAQLSEENYELAMELLKEEIVCIQTKTLMLEMKLTNCLEQVQTEIAIESEEE